MTTPKNESLTTAERIAERAERLFEDGYSAEVVHEMAVHVTNPHGVTYTVDPVNEECNCAYFVKNLGTSLCKHILGWAKLIQDQYAAAYPFAAGDMAFCLGKPVATPGAIEAIQRNGKTPIHFLLRHASKDWGDLEADDKRANERALLENERIVSQYDLPDGTSLLCITEWNRTLTTLLTGPEY